MIVAIDLWEQMGGMPVSDRPPARRRNPEQEASAISTHDALTFAPICDRTRHGCRG